MFVLATILLLLKTLKFAGQVKVDSFKFHELLKELEVERVID